MGACNIDHSHDDVVKKLQDQESFLPVDLLERLQLDLTRKHSQESLNVLFHLLKKYDLASESEREKRNDKLMEFVNK